MTLPEAFASQADAMVSNLLQTDYQHIEHIFSNFHWVRRSAVDA
jgi:hypothetical protein